MCELELDWLDMRINTKKSCCLRDGSRFDLPSATITTVLLMVTVSPWVSEKRYLGRVHTLRQGEDSGASYPCQTLFSSSHKRCLR